ncbi:MAG TPA: MXAN_6640 family putative metalloprotease [Candidatus Deferrimicrobium sp.]|nr:MXAN_6640 family putative metalloprotease [Candidatus Deferrimicrobium sp.]
MFPKRFRAILLGLLLVTACPLCLHAAKSDADPLQLIDADYQRGRLTLDEKVVLQIAAIKEPHRLPQAYLVSDLTLGKPAARGVTLVLRDIRLQWDQLSPETRLAFEQAFSRWSTAYTYVSPGGYFKLHYDLAGTHQVPSADDDFSGVPDFVEKCAAYCDTSYAVHSQWGFLRPPSDGGLGGDTLFDVYFENMAYYGYAQPEGLGSAPWDDYYSYLVLNNDFLGFDPNDDPEGDQYGAAKATVAHEFHHCVQFAYDISEGNWFMELDATTWEDLIFDATNDNYNFLSDFFPYPEKSLMENSGHYYSCFIWGLYLAQKFDTSLLVSCWESARYDDIFSSLSDTLLGRYGWTQDSAFADFAVWNYCTASRNDNLHHEEAGSYPLAAVGRTHSSYPVLLQTSPRSPAGYGACYIDFFPGTFTGNFRLTFNGDDSRRWAAYLIKSTADNVHEIEKIPLDTITNYGVVDVNDFESHFYRLTLVGINVSEFSAGAFFSYSADVVQPYGVASVVLTTDSAVYSGGTRQFQYQVSNTSTNYDVFDVSYWDDLGWVVPDTVDKAIPPGHDSVFLINVYPPQGTPLQTVAQLRLNVRSRGDTTVTDSQTTAALTMLQRGDVDFSGAINVSDLTYLVAFLFSGGVAPVPVVGAADFDCSTKINITDLTNLVSFLFATGGPPPCNPY